VARDYARGRKPAAAKPAARRKSRSSSRSAAAAPASRLKWFGAGLLSGVFLSFMAYLGSLPAEPGTGAQGAEAQAQAQPAAVPKPRFDFYTLLPEQTIDVQVDPAEVTAPRDAPGATETYLLQAGSFRQREDADRRRAELLLLGLEPSVEETTGDNGRWFRVYLGPFDSRSKMSRARSLTAGQSIDTLVLKRDRP
jgi:cell division septation protein DedD